MPEIIIAGNWKMYKTAHEAVDLVNELKEGLKEMEKKGQSKNWDSPDSIFGDRHLRSQSQFFSPTVVVCPPFTVLGEVKKALEGSVIKLGSQNMFWEEDGAYTGEISAKMLLSTGCEFVILGHSERRIHFGETDSDINKKVRAAISSGLRPIICCGEKLEEREKGEAKNVVERQIKGVFKNIKESEFLKCVIAYEPVWAIGTGKTATPDEAQEMHQFIRSILSKIYSSQVSSSISILYGGSVKPENIKELMEERDINGALVGGASLKAESFLKIINPFGAAQG